MYFAPHILQRKTVTPPNRDEFGRVIAPDSSEEWITVCACRCDDNTTKEFKSENGEVFRPQYHVVCAGNQDIKAGEYVRCIVGDEVRGEGEVSVFKKTNYYKYTELWM